MPELPDLVYVADVLGRALGGRRVAAARVGDPTVLRLMIPEPFPAALLGRRFVGVERRGHFLRFEFGGAGQGDGAAATPEPEPGGNLLLVVNAMLVGRYRLLAAEEAAREKDPVALGLAIRWDDGRELRYLDEKRMGKVYVVRAAAEQQVPVYGALGIEVLSPQLDRARFRALARGRRDQVRRFLMDKQTLASIG